jgi:hypothetical protein
MIIPIMPTVNNWLTVLTLNPENVMKARLPYHAGVIEHRAAYFERQRLRIRRAFAGVATSRSQTLHNAAYSLKQHCVVLRKLAGRHIRIILSRHDRILRASAPTQGSTTASRLKDAAQLAGAECSGLDINPMDG